MHMRHSCTLTRALLTQPAVPCAGFFWGNRFQQYDRGAKRALFGVMTPLAKAFGNIMKIIIWPVLLLPVTHVFTTSLR